jgi:hypothetical protein
LTSQSKNRLNRVIFSHHTASNIHRLPRGAPREFRKTAGIALKQPLFPLPRRGLSGQTM